MISATDHARRGDPAAATDSVHGFFQRHPEWWAVLAAAGAWAAMVELPHLDAVRHAHHGHAAPAGPGVLATAAMVVAMMLPLTLPSIRHVADASRGRPRRAMAGYLAGYLAVWMVGMLAISAGWALAASFAGWTAAAAGTVTVAAVWEAAPVRRRLAHGSGRTVPLAADGWRADAKCVRYGATSGIVCVGTCWALMAACVAFAHSLPVMVMLFGVQLAGRYGLLRSPAPLVFAVLGTGLTAIAARVAG